MLFSTCTFAQNETIMWVNSHKVSCTGVAPMQCLLVQKSESIKEGQWQFFYSTIGGFNFEEGYICKLKVKEEKLANVPADASAIKYTLVEVLEKQVDTKQMLQGKWDALKINGSIIKQTRQRGASAIPFIEIDVSKMHFSGLDGCNNLHTSIKKLDEKNIELGNLAATQKMCPDMAIANQFNKAIVKVKAYSITSTTLTFYDKEGAELLEFVKGTEAKILLNDIWVAEFIGGKSLANKAGLPQLEFHTTNLTVLGTDGCNSFRAKLLKLNNTEIIISPPLGTKKMCADMDVANQFNQEIIKVRKYKIAKLKLTLLDEQGKVVMILRKVD